jgi:shikimate 5-dehydrogenase
MPAGQPARGRRAAARQASGKCPQIRLKIIAVPRIQLNVPRLGRRQPPGAGRHDANARVRPMADVLFVGVSTASSLIHRAMPAWQPLLPVPCGVRGVDIARGSPASAFTALLDRLSGDDSAAGAVVTSHKVSLYQAGLLRFDWLDPLALACEEVNAIRRTPAGLLGWARDPVSVGRVVDRIWPSASGQVICLGAGGTARALARYLGIARPRVRLDCADTDAAAVQRLTGLAGWPVTGYAGGGPWDHLVGTAPAGSLIVNATGLGKDRPGSPVTSEVLFPQRATVWDLNYRGELDFLRQAQRQAAGSGLRVHDGWQLFCHGWAAALTVILGLPEDSGLGEKFAAAAAALRPAAG